MELIRLADAALAPGSQDHCAGILMHVDPLAYASLAQYTLQVWHM